MKQWLRSLRSFGGERSGRIASIVVVFGLAAALVAPTNLSAAPFRFGLGEEAESTKTGSGGADLLLPTTIIAATSRASARPSSVVQLLMGPIAA